MSHIAKVKVEFKDLTALQAACAEIGAELDLKKQEYRFFDGNRATGIKIKLPGWSHPVILTEKNEAVYDNFGGRWGDIGALNRLKQEYTAKATMNSLQNRYRMLDHQIERLPNGYIRIKAAV